MGMTRTASLRSFARRFIDCVASSIGVIRRRTRRRPHASPPAAAQRPRRRIHRFPHFHPTRRFHHFRRSHRIRRTVDVVHRRHVDAQSVVARTPRRRHRSLRQRPSLVPAACRHLHHAVAAVVVVVVAARTRGSASSRHPRAAARCSRPSSSSRPGVWRDVHARQRVIIADRRCTSSRQSALARRCRELTFARGGGERLELDRHAIRIGRSSRRDRRSALRDRRLEARASRLLQAIARVWRSRITQKELRR